MWACSPEPAPSPTQAYVEEMNFDKVGSSQAKQARARSGPPEDATLVDVCRQSAASQDRGPGRLESREELCVARRSGAATEQ